MFEPPRTTHPRADLEWIARGVVRGETSQAKAPRNGLGREAKSDQPGKGRLLGIEPAQPDPPARSALQPQPNRPDSPRKRHPEHRSRFHAFAGRDYEGRGLLTQRTASPSRTVVFSHQAFAHGHLDAGASRTPGFTCPPSKNRPLKFSYRAFTEEGFGHFRYFGFDLAAVTYANAKEKRSQENQNDGAPDPPNHRPCPTHAAETTPRPLRLVPQQRVAPRSTAEG